MNVFIKNKHILVFILLYIWNEEKIQHKIYIIMYGLSNTTNSICINQKFLYVLMYILYKMMATWHN